MPNDVIVMSDNISLIGYLYLSRINNVIFANMLNDIIVMSDNIRF